MSDDVNLEELERASAELAAASSPSDVFRRLLEGSRLAAPRAAILLVRQAQLKGWGSHGYTAEPSRRLRELTLPADAGWLGQLLADADRGTGSRGSNQTDPDFGQPSAAETVGVPVRVGGRRPVGVLIAERGSGERPWSTPALRLLATIAQVRLELDLAHRKIKGSRRGEAAPVEAAAKAEPTAAAATGTSETATELAPAADEAPAGADDAREPARRYARLIATDIRLYNEELVMLGRRHGDLAARIGEHLGRGKETFLRRFPDLGPEGLEILHEAFVQVLAAGDRKLLPTKSYT